MIEVEPAADDVRDLLVAEYIETTIAEFGAPPFELPPEHFDTDHRRAGVGRALVQAPHARRARRHSRAHDYPFPEVYLARDL